jgi:hypothetical protein
MELIVQKKCVFGNDYVYPVCDKSKTFACIARTKTLLPDVVELIKKLGYKLTTESEEV